MFMGNVNVAIRLLSDSTCGGGSLLLESVINAKSVKDILLEKHPTAQPPNPLVITTQSSSLDFHPIIFEFISPELICSTALKMGGSSDPSGQDAAAWKCLCTSFRSSSNDLCAALSSLGRCLCTEYVDPVGLYPLLSSRLIALDKNPGVRPIGMGERLHVTS